MQIAGHEVDFFDFQEIVGSGPEACSLTIDGNEIVGKRFDPSPIKYLDGILIPARKSNFLVYGYSLCYINFSSLKCKFVSKVLPYMRLIEISDGRAKVQRNTFSDETVLVDIK